MMHHNIAILGCGISGMISALSLASKNIKSTIIERSSSSEKGFFSDVRTTALTSSSKEFFQEIGIWDKLHEFVGNINDIYVVDNKSDEMLHFDSSKLSNQEIMGYLIKNTDFKKVLFDLVAKNSLITVIEDCSYEVSKNTIDGCSLVLNNKITHKCDLIFVCDGRNSDARIQYFSSDVEKNYDQCAFTFIVHHEKSHEGTAVEHFMSTGPFAILPLKDKNFSSIVWTVDFELKKVLEGLSKNDFLEVVQDNFGKFLGKITIKGEAVAFPLKAYETNKYFNKRIVLLADTAHIIHPLAGQGLNQGIKDIACLMELLLEYGISDYMLKKYQRSRKSDNNIMLEATDAINSIFSNNHRTLRLGRHLGFKIINKIPVLKEMMIKYAMGRR